MLSSLRIQNPALVEDLSLDWRPGFTVLTGAAGPFNRDRAGLQKRGGILAQGDY